MVAGIVGRKDIKSSGRRHCAEAGGRSQKSETRYQNAEGRGRKSKAKSQKPKVKTRREEPGRKAARGDANSATIPAPNIPAGVLQHFDCPWPSLGWLK